MSPLRSTETDLEKIPFRSRCFAETCNPSLKLFEMMPPVPHALRVNDVSERDLSSSSSGARFIAATISLLAKDQFLAKKMPWRGPIRGNNLPVDALELERACAFLANRLPASNSRTCPAVARSSRPNCASKSFRGPFRRHAHSAHFCVRERIETGRANSSKIRSSSRSSVDLCIIE